MSKCPACGLTGEHVGFYVPWSASRVFPPDRRIMVAQRCLRDECPQTTWYEAPDDAAAIRKRLDRVLDKPTLFDEVTP